MEDFEGWEVLPDDGFLEIHDDDGKQIFSRRYGPAGSNNVFKNYFICPSPSPPKSTQFVDSTEYPIVPKQLVTVPIQFEPPPPPAQLPDDPEFLRKITMPYPIQINNLTPSTVLSEKIGGGGATEVADQDPVSQVSFKKKKEAEFVEMKMDSPKSNNSSRAIKPQIDSATFQFDEKAEEAFRSEATESKVSSPKFRTDEDEQTVKTIGMDPEVQNEIDDWEENSGGINIWKWSLTGIGAICSFGVAAAATVCIIILGGRQKNKHHQDNRKLQFHIYADDKVFIYIYCKKIKKKL